MKGERYWDDIQNPYQRREEMEKIVEVTYRDEKTRELKKARIPNWGLGQWLEGPCRHQIVDWEVVEYGEV